MKFLHIKALVLALACTSIGSVQAQVNPMGAQYYLNQYLVNPAMAGAEEGVIIGGGFRKQTSSFPGAPQDQHLTATYRMNRVGIGLNFNNEKAGLLRQNRTVGTFSYHVPVTNKDGQLHLGVSIGAYTERLSNEDISGDPNDPTIGQLNRREIYLDGDAGAAFTTDRLLLQAAVPNLKNLFNKDFKNVSNLASFNSSVAYKFDLSVGNNGVVLEPRLGFRGIKGFEDIFDAGARIGMVNDAISLFGIYHSTNSVSIGFGALTLKETLTLQAIYTTETAALRTYSSGNFEIALKYRIF